MEVCVPLHIPMITCMHIVLLANMPLALCVNAIASAACDTLYICLYVVLSYTRMPTPFIIITHLLHS